MAKRAAAVQANRPGRSPSDGWTLLALIGGLLGGGLAYLVANGYHTATMNWQSFSQVAFQLTVTPRLLAGGIAYALVMGFCGGIFPAVRAVRTPIAVGLRGG